MKGVSMMGDMTVEELKGKKLWFLWSTKPAKNGKVSLVNRQESHMSVCHCLQSM